MSESLSSPSAPVEQEPRYAANDGEIIDAEIVDEYEPAPGKALEPYQADVIDAELVTEEEYQSYRAAAEGERQEQRTQTAYDLGSLAVFGVAVRFGGGRNRNKNQAPSISEERTENARNIIRGAQADATSKGLEREAQTLEQMASQGDERLYKDVNKLEKEANTVRRELKRLKGDATDEEVSAKTLEAYDRLLEEEMAKPEMLRSAGLIRRAHLLKTLSANNKLTVPFSKLAGLRF
jgi:hypothetical protein